MNIARRKAEIWCQDEARVGQLGRTVRVWFERGQRPRRPRDMRHKVAWIFGAACPARDTGGALVPPVATTEAMQVFLEEPALAVPADRHAVLLPPYSPEPNGIERVWLHLKDRVLGHRIFKDMATIIDACCEAWNSLPAETGSIKTASIRALANMPWLKQVKSS